MEKKEKDLIRQLKKGQESAYRLLFEHYYAQLCKVSNFYVSDKFAAENIVEDFFSSFWEHRETINIQSSLKGYLFTAIRNRSLNYLKRNNLTRERNFSSFIKDISDVILPQSESGLELMIGQELDKKIKGSISGLPEECRKVFLLSRQENLKYKEISDLVGTSVNTVQYHMKNALATLRKELKEYMY